MPKKIVITGGPGSGKTTLINRFKEMGFSCLPEISRQITAEAQKKGIEQLFLKDPLLFSKKLLEGRLSQYKDAKNHTPPFLFYDRGLPDVTAYMNYFNTRYPSFFTTTCEQNRYDAVFILPPWKAIYKQDKERYETYEEAVKIHDFLLDEYSKFNYKVFDVAPGTVEERIAYIQNKLEQIF
jgi:predicted ATPase